MSGSFDQLGRNRPLRSIIARNLRRARQMAELTQKQAAQALDVTRNVISSWERGEHQPTMGKLDLVSDIYDVPAWALLHPNFGTRAVIEAEDEACEVAEVAAGESPDTSERGAA